MEPSSKKRKLQGSGPDNRKPPGKRAKTGGNNKPGKSKKKGAAARSTEGFRKMDAAALPWMEDPGGIMGLEVLEGVEVVKTGDKVEFLVPEALGTGSKENSSKAVEEKQDEIEEEEEFEGFDDSPVEGVESDKEMADASSKNDAQEKEDLDEEDEEDDDESDDGEHDDPPNDDEVLDSQPDIPLDTDMSAWSALNLSPGLLSAISRLNFSSPTAIQSAAIPEVLAGHDVIGKASTGSGKTLAFALPIIERWLQDRAAPQQPPSSDSDDDSDDEPEKIPTALILSPTRELAHQLVDHIKAVCAGLPSSPYVCSVTGGLSVLKQQRQLAKADIVIATPGRLWEVISTDIPLLQAFKRIQFLVVDEADRLLSEGHFKEAEEILAALDREEMGFDEAGGSGNNDNGGGAGESDDEEDDDDEESVPRQTLVFSATFNKALQQKLAGKGKGGKFNLLSEGQSMEYLLQKLRFREEKPKFIDVNPVSQMADKLKEGLVECQGLEKDLYLYAVLALNPVRKTLVFTNSIAAVRRITPMLQNLDLKALPLHSQMPQKARLRSLERFAAPGKANESVILVATDVAARGLDIPSVDQVVHYHVPRAADAYVHRSGRTARGDKSGLSILLCAPEEVTPTRRLVAKVHAEKAAKQKYLIRTIDINRKVVGKLKPRLTLAKRLADATIAKDKDRKEDDWVRGAAEELGVEYDSEELEGVKSWAGRGSGKKAKEKEAATLTRAEMGAMRAELRELLAKRVNLGVSERYVTGGRVDVDKLLRDQEKGGFLGQFEGLMDDD